MKPCITFPEFFVLSMRCLYPRPIRLFYADRGKGGG